MSLTIEHLNKLHIRNNFECGYPILNQYIQRLASQDVKRSLSACYVLKEFDQQEVLGYYTLSSASIPKEHYTFSESLPTGYHDLPTILLGRLAIHNKIKGQGLGESLLMDALKRCSDISKELGIVAVVVDPIDNIASSFYSKYGFILLPGTGKMFIPIKTIEQLW